MSYLKKRCIFSIATVCFTGRYHSNWTFELKCSREIGLARKWVGHVLMSFKLRSNPQMWEIHLEGRSACENHGHWSISTFPGDFRGELFSGNLWTRFRCLFRAFTSVNTRGVLTDYPLTPEDGKEKFGVQLRLDRELREDYHDPRSTCHHRCHYCHYHYDDCGHSLCFLLCYVDRGGPCHYQDDTFRFVVIWCYKYHDGMTTGGKASS